MSLWGPFPFKHQNADLTGIQNARITVLWKLPYRFQRKAYEARKYVSGSELLKEVLQRARHKVVRQKLKMQWRPHKSRKVSNMEYLLWKVSGNKW